MNFYIAAIVGTIASFIVGCLWYSVIFGKTWQKLMTFSDERVKSIFKPGRILCAFIAEWFATACITGILFNANLPAHITGVMVAVALLFSGVKLGVFDGKSLKLILINQGYTAVSVLVIVLSYILII